MANSTSHVLPYPIRNARFTLELTFRTSAGTPTDPTTPDTEFSSDGGATFSDCAEEITTGGANGLGYFTLTGAEMNNNILAIAAKSANCVLTPVTLSPRILALIGSGTLSAGSAGGGTLGTVLAYDVTGCFIRTTGGTGGGGTGGANNQARRIVTYTPSTGAFTVSPNWETTPDATTTYDVLLPEGVTLGMLRTLNPATAGRQLVVDTSGLADATMVKVGPTGSGTVQTAGDIIGDTNDIQGRLPASLTGGKMESNIGSVTAGIIAAASFAANALDAVWSTAARILTAATNITSTGGTTVPQTGDSFTRIGAPVGASISADVALVQADTDNLQTRVPAALVGGRMDASVGAMAAGVVTAAAIATDAIDADAVAADAVTEIQSGLSTLTAAGVRTAVGLASANLDTQLADLPTAAETADAVLDEDMTAHQAQGSLGQAIGDPVADTNTIYKAVVTDAADATVGLDVVAVKAETASIQADTNDIQGRLPSALTGGKMESNLGSITAGVIAAASFAANALDAVWSTAVRVLTAATNLTTALATPTNITAASGVSLTAAYDPAKTASQAGDAMALTSGERTSLTGVIWAALTSGLVTLGSIGKLLVDQLDAAISSRSSHSAAGAATAVRTELTTELARIDVAVSTRGTGTALDAAGVRTAVGLGAANLDIQLGDIPTNAELTAALATSDDAVLAAVAAAKAVIDFIDAKTTNLPSDPADESLIIDATNALAAAIAALNNISTAQVLAQVATALATTTYPEPAGPLPATASLEAKISWMAMLARNKQTIDGLSGEQLVKADNGATDVAKATTTTVGDVTTRGEWTTP
jgi:hypothetical protein